MTRGPFPVEALLQHKVHSSVLLDFIATRLPVDPYEYRPIHRAYAVNVGRIAMHVLAGGLAVSYETRTADEVRKAIGRRPDHLFRHPEEQALADPLTRQDIIWPMSRLRPLLIAVGPDGEETLLDGALRCRHGSELKQAEFAVALVNQKDILRYVSDDGIYVPEDCDAFHKLPEPRQSGSGWLMATLTTALKHIWPPAKWGYAIIPFKRRPGGGDKPNLPEFERIRQEAVVNLLRLMHAEEHLHEIDRRREPRRTGDFSQEAYFAKELVWHERRIAIGGLGWAALHKNHLGPAATRQWGVKDRRHVGKEIDKELPDCSPAALETRRNTLKRRQYIIGIIMERMSKWSSDGELLVRIENRGAKSIPIDGPLLKKLSEISKNHFPKNAQFNPAYVTLFEYERQSQSPDALTIDDLINVASDTGVNAAIYFPEFQRWAGPLDWFAAMHAAKENGEWGITPQMAEMWLSRRAIALTHTDVYAAPWQRLWDAMLQSLVKLQTVDTRCAECLGWYIAEVRQMQANPEFHTADSAGKPNSRNKDRTYFVSASASR